MNDVEQIRRVLAQYCQLMDDRRYVEWSQLFAPDAVWALGGREHRGPAEMQAYMDRLRADNPDRRTKHLCTNVALVLAVDGQTASATSDYVMLAHTPGQPWQIASGGRYLDRLARREPEGTWQFSERILTR